MQNKTKNNKEKLSKMKMKKWNLSKFNRYGLENYTSMQLNTSLSVLANLLCFTIIFFLIGYGLFLVMGGFFLHPSSETCRSTDIFGLIGSDKGRKSFYSVMLSFSCSVFCVSKPPVVFVRALENTYDFFIKNELVVFINYFAF